LLTGADEILLVSRNEIVSADEWGLTLRIGDGDQIAPWSQVTSATVAKSKQKGGDAPDILVLVFEMQIGDHEHVLLIGETDPAWVAVTTAMDSALPDIAPFCEWGVDLLIALAPIELYRRDAASGQAYGA
jgi:hypothetical protein